jgi:hypothetical protein
MGRQV